MDKNELQTIENSITDPKNKDMLSLNELSSRVIAVQQAMRAVMEKDVDYGVIPGTPKPSLYKAGAEKICSLFRLRPEFENFINQLDDGHIEVYSECKLFHISTGELWGSCRSYSSTMEPKFRFKKNGGTQDPYGNRHTVLMIAEKRSFVGATRIATASSGLFTQDMEDIPDKPEIRKHYAPDISNIQDVPKIESKAEAELNLIYNTIIEVGEKLGKNKEELKSEYSEDLRNVKMHKEKNEIDQARKILINIENEIKKQLVVKN
jgi:hypothetical protein